MEINVKNVFEEAEAVNNILFISEKKPDRNAAAMRLTKTEELLENWHRDVNITNTREMPTPLVQSYQRAFEALVSICEQERKIILGE